MIGLLPRLALALLPLIVWPGWGATPFSGPKRWVLTGLSVALAGLLTWRSRGRAAALLQRSARELTPFWICWAVALVAAPTGSAFPLQELLLGGAFLIIAALAKPVCEAAFEKGIRAAILGAWLVSLVLVAQWLGFDPFTPTDGLTSGKWRYYSTLGNPNRLAWYLALVFVIALLSFREDPLLRRLSLAIFGFGLLITLSRGAWLALAVTLAWLVIRHERRLWRALAAMAGTLAAAALLVPSEHWSRWVLNRESIEGRWYPLARAWELLLEHPWKGIGLGRFTELVDQPVEYVHQEYLGIAIEIGVPAALLLFWGVYRTWRRTSDPRIKSALLLVAVLGIYDFPLREPSVLMLASSLLIVSLSRDRSPAQSLHT